MAADPIIEEIKQRIDIVDLIRNYITLKPSGANFKGLCPFHPEKTPSFMVNRERQWYRCFGCGEAGDVFDFVQKQENIDFPNALQLLAGKAGVTLPEKSTNSKATTKPGMGKADLQAINLLAAQFFHHILVNHPAGKPALEYLLGRGVTQESIKQFQIGFAPANNTAIKSLLAKHNFSAQAIQLSGSPERFRNRIMFPFYDVIGNVVGFSGRAMGDAMPKYLNTADTELFHKNRFLYGLYYAKKPIAEAGNIVLVEGQLDLVLGHQTGVTTAVATSGTALTDDHLRILRRYSDALHLALDGDAAGRKATERAISLALNHGFEVKVMVLPDGADPGDLAIKDPKAWRSLVEKPIPAIEWLFGYYFPSSRKPSSSERIKIYDALFPYIEKQPDEVSRAWALQHLARLMEVSDDKAIREAFDSWKAKQQGPAKSPLDTQSQDGNLAHSVKASESVASESSEEARREKSLIGLILVHPELLGEPNLSLSQTDFTKDSLARLYNAVFSWYNKSTTKSSTELLSFLKRELPEPVYQAIQKLVFDTQTATNDLSPDQLKGEYAFLVQSVRQRLRRDRIESYASLIAQAASEQNNDRVRELMQEMQNSIKQSS